MNRPFAVHTGALLLVLAVAPTHALADLVLRIGPQSSPEMADVQYTGRASLPAGRQFFDLVFDEPNFQATEVTNAYDVALRLVAPSGAPAGGVRLDGLERPPDHFVFDVPGGATFSMAENRPDYVLANVFTPNEDADPAAGMKVARVFYTIDPGLIRPGDYRIEFDTAVTGFNCDDPNRGAPSLTVSLNDVGLIRYTLPEPTGLPLLLASGALTLRRRHRRSGRANK